MIEGLTSAFIFVGGVTVVAVLCWGIKSVAHAVNEFLKQRSDL